jgi:HSP20 family protein
VEPFWRPETFLGSALPADIVENERDYVISVEMPGMEAADIEVASVEDRLTIKGEKKERKDEQRKGVHLSERHYGLIQRSFRMPEGVDTAGIEASFKNGVLTLTLPKTAEAQTAERKIAVKEG